MLKPSTQYLCTIAGTRWRLPCGHLTWMRACRLTCSQVRVQSDCSGLTHGQYACCANGWHCSLRIFGFAPDRWPLPQGATPGRSGKVLHSCAVILTSSPVFQTSPTPPFAAPAGRPLPKVQTPGRKMLRSGSAALQRLTQMVGRSRQIYKASLAATCVLSGLACSAHAQVAGFLGPLAVCMHMRLSVELVSTCGRDSDTHCCARIPAPRLCPCTCNAGSGGADRHPLPRLRFALRGHARGSAVRAAVTGALSSMLCPRVVRCTTHAGGSAVRAVVAGALPSMLWSQARCHEFCCHELSNPPLPLARSCSWRCTTWVRQSCAPKRPATSWPGRWTPA